MPAGVGPEARPLGAEHEGDAVRAERVLELALGIAGALLWIPYAEWRYVDRVDLRILGFCVVGAGAILGTLVSAFSVRRHLKRIQ